MVAIMDEAAILQPGQSVLEIGAGSGYHAATIAEIVGAGGRVYTVEIIESLARVARQNLEKAGYLDRVRILNGDGSLGYQENAPYDRIIVTAAAPEILPGLLEQLSSEGILVIPVGGRSFLQQLFRVRKQESGRALVENLGGVAFVPLVGEKGHSI